MSDTQQTQTPATEAATSGGEQGQQGEQQEQSFTQADVDEITAKVRREERRKVSEKFSDYDDLKAKASEKATAEERLTDLEKQLEQAQRETLRRRVQAAHGIADEDADLFLSGDDEETLTAQAERLAARESERKKRSNHVPTEGKNPRPSQDPMREFTRELFQRGD